MSGRNNCSDKRYDNLFRYKGRAGRTGQSQTGECYVIAHERDMKQVNFDSILIDYDFLCISFERCYLPSLKIIPDVIVICQLIIIMQSNNFY